MILLALAVIVLFIGSLVEASCPNGYVNVTEAGHCYKLYTKLQNYADAVATCRNDNAYLVHVENAFENTLLQNNVTNGEDIWLGLTCTSNSTAGCRWNNDGSALTYSNFLRPPDTSVGTCVLMYGQGSSIGRWASAVCDRDHLSFVCQYAPCENEWTAISGYCYKVMIVVEGMYHDEAERLCHDSGAQLGSIHSKEENDQVGQMVHAIVASSGVWLGHRRVGSTTQFEWSDGTPWDYEIWYPGYPSTDPTRSWGQFDAQYAKWFDYYDMLTSYAICKKAAA